MDFENLLAELSNQDEEMEALDFDSLTASDVSQITADLFKECLTVMNYVSPHQTVMRRDPLTEKTMLVSDFAMSSLHCDDEKHMSMMKFMNVLTKGLKSDREEENGGTLIQKLTELYDYRQYAINDEQIVFNINPDHSAFCADVLSDVTSFTGLTKKMDDYFEPVINDCKLHLRDGCDWVSDMLLNTKCTNATCCYNEVFGLKVTANIFYPSFVADYYYQRNKASLYNLGHLFVSFIVNLRELYNMYYDPSKNVDRRCYVCVQIEASQQLLTPCLPIMNFTYNFHRDSISVGEQLEYSGHSVFNKQNKALTSNFLFGNDILLKIGNPLASYKIEKISDDTYEVVRKTQEGEERVKEVFIPGDIFSTTQAEIYSFPDEESCSQTKEVGE